MSNQKPHIVYYKNEQQPHVVIFQNPDGSWGQDGDLEMFLGLDLGKQKGSSFQPEAYEQLMVEAAYNEEKFEICRKALVDLRNKLKVATHKIDQELQQVENVVWPEEPGDATSAERVVIDVSEDGPSLNEVPLAAGRTKHTPYTRSQAARDGKRGRGMWGKNDG